MGKDLIGFDRELEIGVLDRIGPLRRNLRLELSVEGGVDLAGVEVMRQVGQLWRCSPNIALHGARIHHTFPVRVRVARCADKEFCASVL